MMKIGKYRYFFISVIWLLMAGFAAWIMLEEATSTSGFSIQSENHVSTRCLAEMTTVKTRLSSPLIREEIFNNCANSMNSITQISPSNSYAWFVKAYATHKSDLAKFNNAMENSFRFGPYAFWIAELRAPLNLKVIPLLSRLNQTGYQRDLSLLFAHQRGIEQLARLYQNHEDFQTIFLPVLAKQTHENQRKFLRELRHQTAQYAD